MKRNRYKKGARGLLLVCLALLLLVFAPMLPKGKNGDMSAVNASASGGDLIAVHRYDVDMKVEDSREIKVREQITVEFLQRGLTMFYRSLPTDGSRYRDVKATCVGNDEFHYKVVDNPDKSGFIDVECIGNAQRGKTWTYEITYTMIQGVKSEKGMTIDVIGFGWSVPLHKVTATLRLPAPAQSHKVYQGPFGTASEGNYTLSADKRTLTFSTDVLPLNYTEVYDEVMAEGVTVELTFDGGVLVGYAKSRIFTEHIGKILLVAVGCILLAVLITLTKKKREMITVVSIKPPENMTPMQMGKILDGTVNNEDITSMVYYFADKGYLKINLEEEDDPQLIRLVPALPESASAHEKTLFEGLFPKHKENAGIVKVSELETKFFSSAQKAKAQVLAPKPMYTRLSLVAYLAGGILGALFAFFACYLMGKTIGGGYSYWLGFFLALPIGVNLFLRGIAENYRFKWKPSRRYLILSIELLIVLICGCIFVFSFAEFFMTEWEKLIICIGAFSSAFLTQGMLTRTEKYTQTLGQILGFKDFITVTEEDKIEFMLRDNPELYYQVLPYAQALGVTDEWEKKFEKLTVEPPTWYAGGSMTTFDYLYLNRCMNRAMLQSMAAAAKSQGGGHIGSGGGGGSFGGFGGGGFGGGGGGAR